MKKIWGYIKLGLLWLYTSFHILMIRISIGLFNVEQEVLKADVLGGDEKNKQNQRVRHRNPIAEKMLQGQRDQQFVKDYYEVLKKADKFMRNSTPDQIEMTANKHGLSLGKTSSEMKNVGRKPEDKPKKDKWGRRYEHFGFYDGKNKNYGKTMGEVIIEETKQRVTKDDDNAIEFMFSNIPTSIGFVDNEYVVEDKALGFREINSYEKAKVRKHPMKVQRKNEECFNKIEQLTEYLHVRRIDDTHKILEFFIPAKYNVFDFDVKSDTFTEIIDIENVWINDEYHNMYGYNVYGFQKRVEVIDESVVSTDEDVIIYHVIKLKARAIEKIG